jgi:hypothetical protein
MVLILVIINSMAVKNLYSNRLQPKTEKLEFDILPNELRIQLVYIWEQFFSQRYFPKEISDRYTNELAKILMLEHALESLPQTLQQ